MKLAAERRKHGDCYLDGGSSGMRKNRRPQSCGADFQAVDGGVFTIADARKLLLASVIPLNWSATVLLSALPTLEKKKVARHDGGLPRSHTMDPPA